MVLGLVIDRFSDGVGYERFVQDMLRRIGIFRMKLEITQSQFFDMSEVLVNFLCNIILTMIRYYFSRLIQLS